MKMSLAKFVRSSWMPYLRESNLKQTLEKSEYLYSCFIMVGCFHSRRYRGTKSVMGFQGRTRYIDTYCDSPKNAYKNLSQLPKYSYAQLYVLYLCCLCKKYAKKVVVHMAHEF